MRCSVIAILGLSLAGCLDAEPKLWPARVSQRGGVDLHVRLSKPPDGAVIVLVDGVAAHSVALEGPKLLRVRAPALPRTGTADVEVLFADATAVRFEGALEVIAPELEVRARD